MKTKKTIKYALTADLNRLTPAERKMFNVGGYFPVHKILSKTYSPEFSIRYVQCKYERISDHEIALAENFASRRVLIFDLKWKAFTARYASLNYKLIEAVRERFIELGWDEV